MSLVAEVVLQVGERDLVAVQYDSLCRHEVHEFLGEESHKDLLQDRHDHAPLGGQVQLTPVLLGAGGRVQEVEGFCDSLHGVLVGEVLEDPLKRGVTHYQAEDVGSVHLQLVQGVLRGRERGGGGGGGEGGREGKEWEGRGEGGEGGGVRGRRREEEREGRGGGGRGEEGEGGGKGG